MQGWEKREMVGSLGMNGREEVQSVGVENHLGTTLAQRVKRKQGGGFALLL